MLLNKNRFRLAYLILFSIALLISSWQWPAYAGRLPWLLLMAITDLYVFWHLSKPGLFQRHWVRKITISFSALPSIMLLGFLLSMLFLSPLHWNPIFRTYLLGFVIFIYIIRMPPLLVLVIIDIKRLINKYLNRRISHSARNIWMRISLGLSMIFALIMTMGMTLWVYDFEIVKKEIPIQGLPQSFCGYKIVHISDLHLGRWHSEKPLREAVHLLNSLEPDLIAFTGDLVNYATSEADPYREILSGLKAKDGVFAVLGNHDYGDYLRWLSDKEKKANIDDMFKLMDEIGWVLLENRNLTLFRYDGCLTLAGIGHFSTKRYIPDRANIQQALSNVSDSCILILLSHTPEIINAGLISDWPVNLMLSGHTHALQFGLRIAGKDFSPAALIFNHWGGLYQLGDLKKARGYLYVNRGLGHIAFPFRIGMKPEITLITLISQYK